MLTVDEWIKFRVPCRIEALILDVRAQLTTLLQRKIAEVRHTCTCIILANALTLGICIVFA